MDIKIKLCNTAKKGKYDDYYTQVKLDGHRAIMVVCNGFNRMFSRRKDKNGNPIENTFKLKHLQFSDTGFPEGTIIDGEVYIKNGGAKEAQQILGSNPERSIVLFDAGIICRFYAFDILKLGNEGLTGLPIESRMDILKDIKKGNYIDTFPLEETSDVKEKYREALNLGFEGLVLKKKGSSYDGKRNDTWLRMKEEKTIDLVVTGTMPATKLYNGKYTKEELKARGWEYWEGDEPVTKAYAKGYCGALICSGKDGENTVEICAISGFSDEEQEDMLRSSWIGEVVEVKYQEVLNKDTFSLRHPRFSRKRPDKNALECTLTELKDG